MPCEVPRSDRHLPRFEAIRDDSGATAVLTTRATLDQVRRRIDPQAPRWIFTEELPDSDAREFGGAGQQTAYLQYTSGSTATPKGVIVTYANVLANLADIDSAFRHSPESIAVNWLPQFHDMGLVYGLLAPIYGGFRCYVMSPAAFVQRPARWLAAITKLRATHAGGPNFAYDLCVEKIAPELRGSFDLRSWKVAFNGAEPVRCETLESFAAAFEPSGFHFQSFHPAYGLAEATLKVTGRDPERAVFCEGNRVSCGVPGPNTTVEIIDGEICVRGAGVAQGYWNRPDDPAFAGGLLHTGDLGYISAGELFITGRAKDLIIVRGRNHYPQDIELTTARAHPALRPGFTAAFSLDVNGVERLAVVAELDRSRESEAAAAIHAIRRAIAETHEVYAWAVVLVRTGSVPKTSSGKIQRQIAKQRYLAGDLEVISASTGLPELEQAPDSLAALERKMELEREYGIEVPITALLGGAATPGDLDELPFSRQPMLSIEQERLWLLDQIEPGNPAFHVPAAFEFESAIDLPRLARALAEVVRHHESLRTTFGNPPVVHEKMPVAIRLGPATEDFVREPFDLARGPLLRLTVDGRRVAAVFHHIVADLWSAAIFFRDLAAAYAGLPLGPLPNTFNDFAAWQRSRLQSGALDPSIEFWRRKLDDLPQLTWPGTNRESGIEEFVVSAPLTARLCELAKQHHATPAMTLLAAWQAVLHRVTTQEDLVVATPVAGRPRAEFAGVVGFFAYPVLLRTDLSGDPAFAELLDRTRAAALEAYMHAEVPFAKVVELVSAGGHCQVRSPLAHSVFNFVRAEAHAADAPPAPTDFDSFLTLIERPDGTLRGVLAHNLGEKVAKALAAAYTQALETVSANPGALVASLELPAAIRPQPRPTIAIAASFTAEPLEPVLGFWMEELQTPARIRFAGFGQVFQSLLDPISSLSRNRDGVNVILVRPGDLKDSTENFTAAVRSAAARNRAPLIVVLCPPSDGIDATELSAIPNVHVITPGRISAVYPVAQIEDPLADELADVPYTTAYFTALGTAIARTISAIRRPPYKVIALDCDQTLWKGVCGEDGPDGIEARSGPPGPAAIHGPAARSGYASRPLQQEQRRGRGRRLRDPARHAPHRVAFCRPPPQLASQARQPPCRRPRADARPRQLRLH